jgi:hypothetical protein
MFLLERADEPLDQSGLSGLSGVGRTDADATLAQLLGVFISDILDALIRVKDAWSALR